MPIDIPDLMRYNTSLEAGKVGGQIGKGVGNVLNKYSDYTKANENKEKIDQYIMAYNNPSDTTVFSGLEGSLRTEKLARLLLPLDPEKSKEYSLKANKEKSDETQLQRSKGVAEAYRSVSDTKEVEDTEGSSKIDAEIKLIEDRLNELKTIPAPIQGIDLNVPVNRYEGNV